MALGLCAAASTASAANRAGDFSFSPVMGLYAYQNSQDLSDNLMYGARAGYNFTKRIGFEGVFDYVKTDIQSTSTKLDMYRYGGQLLYHFMPDSSFVPYLAAGFGGIQFDTGNSIVKGVYDYGVGAKFFVNDSFAFRADVRHLIYSYDKTYSNIEGLIGLYIPFGGAKPAMKPVPPPPAVKAVEPPPPVVVPAPPIDSDSDGVPDATDRCPNTPAGVAVDQYGCPVDSDKDGVPDYLDKCPNTPAGVTVDKDGCPVPPPPAPVAIVVPAASAASVIAAEKYCSKPAVIAIQFDSGKATIKANNESELKVLGNFLKEFPKAKGEISGHTDNAGGKELNLKLSQRRADSIKKYLTDNFGIAPDRITAKGYGAGKPVADNKTAKGKAQNRRIEANFTCE